MDICQQKEIADEILIKLEVLDRYCILAGGAPRDWYFGNLAADLDFYLHVRDNSFIEQKLYGLGLIPADDPNCVRLDDSYWNGVGIEKVVSFTYKNQPIQLVFMHDPTFDSVLSHFSLSICKAWYKKGVLRTDHSFDESVHTKTITQVAPAFGTRYVEKILAKFPDYTLHA